MAVRTQDTQVEFLCNITWVMVIGRPLLEFELVHNLFTDTIHPRLAWPDASSFDKFSTFLPIIQTAFWSTRNKQKKKIKSSKISTLNQIIFHEGHLDFKGF